MPFGGLHSYQTGVEEGSKDEYGSIGIIIGVIVAAILVLVIVGIGVLFLLKRRRKNGETNLRDIEVQQVKFNHCWILNLDSKTDYRAMPAMQDPRYVAMRNSVEYESGNSLPIPKDDIWRIDFKDITINGELGRGAYGIVYRGRWRETDGINDKWNFQ